MENTSDALQQLDTIKTLLAGFLSAEKTNEVMGLVESTVNDAHRKGYDEGYDDGRESGYSDGYDEGYVAGSEENDFN